MQVYCVPFWTHPGKNKKKQKQLYGHLLFIKIFKFDEQDMRDIPGKTKANSQTTFTYVVLYMNVLVLADQQ